MTSAIFVRRKDIHERGVFFDTKWRELGDFHWVLAPLHQNVPMAVSDAFTSIFTDTGDNMNLEPNAIRGKIETAKMVPAWLRLLKPLWVLQHRLRRLRAGHFNSQRPTTQFTRTKARSSA